MSWGLAVLFPTALVLSAGLVWFFTKAWEFAVQAQTTWLIVLLTVTTIIAIVAICYLCAIVASTYPAPKPRGVTLVNREVFASFPFDDKACLVRRRCSGDRLSVGWEVHPSCAPRPFSDCASTTFSVTTQTEVILAPPCSARGGVPDGIVVDDVGLDKETEVEGEAGLGRGGRERSSVGSAEEAIQAREEGETRVAPTLLSPKRSDLAVNSTVSAFEAGAASAATDAAEAARGWTCRDDTSNVIIFYRRSESGSVERVSDATNGVFELDSPDNEELGRSAPFTLDGESRITRKLAVDEIRRAQGKAEKPIAVSPAGSAKKPEHRAVDPIASGERHRWGSSPELLGRAVDGRHYCEFDEESQCRWQEEDLKAPRARGRGGEGSHFEVDVGASTIAAAPEKTTQTAGGLSMAGTSGGGLRNQSAVRVRELPDLCAICLGQYETGEEVHVLPCLHMFHAQCLDVWILGHPSCPYCKADLNVLPPGYDAPTGQSRICRALAGTADLLSWPFTRLRESSLRRGEHTGIGVDILPVTTPSSGDALGF